MQTLMLYIQCMPYFGLLACICSMAIVYLRTLCICIVHTCRNHTTVNQTEDRATEISTIHTQLHSTRVSSYDGVSVLTDIDCTTVSIETTASSFREEVPGDEEDGVVTEG